MTGAFVLVAIMVAVFGVFLTINSIDGWNTRWHAFAWAVGTLAALALLWFVMVGVSSIQYSEGARTGTIVKLSDKGIIWNTTEGNLALSSAALTSDTVFAFSVTDKAIKEQLSAALSSGVRVELRYVEYITVVPWRGDTPYVITAVKTF